MPDGPLFARLDRLAVQNGGRGGGLTALLLAGGFAQVVVQALDHAAVAPPSELVVDRGPGRQVVGQVAPGAAGPQLIEQAVDHFAQGVLAAAAGAPVAGFGRVLL